ncbi:MAG TPA: class I SAM-dependent methyltransferase [Actinophytocola sp.]|uniref:class I SAM-dependent methyltransferase n=1 Tax=Actinophytocola sp. TaxID=1872138 RepID=UPI002DB852CE|nr:class I SAM-dependent methyltransferase [Actinophytocola sp.]HEU5469737.1 class I SAM-dependent methyltransferase [Actinophytocola sp.]
MGGMGRELLLRSMARAGLTQPESLISAQSQQYWNDTGIARWKADSHWRDATVFAESDLWHQLGARHLSMLERGARKVEFTREWGRVVEWGCGGGANAVHFAPRAKEFVGVDISAESLAECGRQVAAHCDTPFRPVQVEVSYPENALSTIDGQCDIFLCCYVFELIPTPEYGERLLRIARDLLAPGGLALIQIKYDDGTFWTRPRRRSYRSGVAQMTTYPIATFWELAQRCGLIPESVELVPRNELDSRYAYFLLSKP